MAGQLKLAVSDDRLYALFQQTAAGTLADRAVFCSRRCQRIHGEVSTGDADGRFCALALRHWQGVVSAAFELDFFCPRLSDAVTGGAAWTFGDVGWGGFVFFAGGDVVFAAIAPGFALRFGRGDWVRTHLPD